MMDELLGFAAHPLFLEPFSRRPQPCAFSTPSVTEAAHGWDVRLPTPGLSHADVSVQVVEGRDGQRSLRLQGPEGSFRHVVRLPPKADAARVSAIVTHGLLRVSVPRAQPLKHQIQVLPAEPKPSEGEAAGAEHQDEATATMAVPGVSHDEVRRGFGFAKQLLRWVRRQAPLETSRGVSRPAKAAAPGAARHRDASNASSTRISRHPRAGEGFRRGRPPHPLRREHPRLRQVRREVPPAAPHGRRQHPRRVPARRGHGCAGPPGLPCCCPHPSLCSGSASRAPPAPRPRSALRADSPAPLRPLAPPQSACP